MTDSEHAVPEEDRTEERAAHWVLRLDRGLTPEEQDEFFDWIAEHPRNSRALARARKEWERLNILADWRPEHANHPNPDLLAPRRKRFGRFRHYFSGLAIAAALAFGFFLDWPQLRPPDPVTERAPYVPSQQFSRQLLADGTTVKLNDDAEVTVLYSPSERRVRLDSGEGFFIVTKDPLRPFIVEVGGVEVRAVGTAFNVSLESEEIEVLVAEGTVSVASQLDLKMDALQVSNPQVTLLDALETATIPLEAEFQAPDVGSVSAHELRYDLGWQRGVITFENQLLSEIVSELNIINEKQLVIGDDTVASMRFSGTIHSDNLEGFARLLEIGFNVRSEADEELGAIRLSAL